jgi:hypothetical protein
MAKEPRVRRTRATHTEHTVEGHIRAGEIGFGARDKM